MKKADAKAKAILVVAATALWAPLLVVVLHSLLTRWLDHEPYVDPFMHFAGGAAAAYFFWQIAHFCSPGFAALSGVRAALIIISLACVAAVAWELMEYLLFVSRGTTKWWGLVNTLRDLSLGFCGAALLALALSRSALPSSVRR
jgi:hypothetical protein